MDLLLPVQKASFQGIYELMEGVFVPKALEWVTIEDVTQCAFENQRGLTFVMAKSNIAGRAAYILNTTKQLTDSPFNLEVSDVLQIIYANMTNIIGPFSNTFSNIHLVHFNIVKIDDPINVSLAVVQLPKGG
jgi:hypothetical protein